MQFRPWTYFLIITLTLASITGASTGTVPDPSDSLKTNDSLQTYLEQYLYGITLALSGGGSRGFAQVGVLQALEEEQIPIELVVGTSIGALIGGLYASGYTAAELKQMILDTDWDELFFDRPARSSLFLTQKRQHGRHILQLRFRKLQPELPLGLTAGHQLTQRLLGLAERAPYHPYPDFDHLKIPFRSIATDLYTGRKVVFRDGSLVAALRASMSMPLIITPMEIDDMLLVDGGVQENIPVITAIDEANRLPLSIYKGAPPVVAVNTSAPGIDFRTPDIPWEIADRVTTIMQQDDNRENLKLADVIIAPDVATQNSTDFDNLEALIDSGYHAAKAKIPEIRTILDAHKNAINNSRLTGEHWDIKSLAVQGNTLLDDNKLTDLFTQELPYRANSLKDQQTDIQSFNSRILGLYRAIGATQAWIESTDYDQSSGQQTITLNEGIITEITVEGLEHTHTWGVLRDFPLKPGDIFQIDVVERGIRQIYASELFESVFMTTERTEHGVRIHLQVKERETRQLRWGARADLERRGATFLEFLDDNLFGLHVRFDLFGKYGEKDELYQASLISDRIAQSYLSAEINSYHRRTEWYFRDFDHDKMGGYDFERSGGVVTLGVQPGRWGQASAGLRAERVLSSYVGQKHDLRLAMFELCADIDTQDRSYFPTQGSRFSFLYQSSGKYLKSDASYVKTDWLFDSYMEVVRRHVLGFHFLWGVADATIPHSEKFRLGGQNSLLGLHQGELVGNARVNFGVTYQFDLISRFLADTYLLAHYTTGGVWNGAEYSVHPDDFLQGVGVSFGMNTILGPITATWGRLIQAGDYSRNDIFYLSAGHNF